MSGMAVEQQIFQLRFQSIFDVGKAMAFPCSRAGVVDLDTFSRKLLNNYLYARASVGREFLFPKVEVVLPENG